ncbi:hypothetical protein LU674_031475 [Pseudomonas alloputida]|uniref:Uncharacterized protein n=2 Tax=Pseudomonas putida group TaxID=136845 RepID=A0A7V8EF25_PSEPU|nr:MULTISPECIES: hypothetical protein [Pseudomonas]KAF0253650.1 hypothetical protein GN299_16840 [Pseudomonas putida]MCE0861926.1 hypothetical protein [Pseudomonas alloputida]MCE0868006.1 hypothetical protein [Pseudomonas alloputida]MCE0891356.1 hypothetical protein [Pseudomonas alloputida]MCE0920477.1 hypothetical protein [Pseudomonas alloputida]
MNSQAALGSDRNWRPVFHDCYSTVIKAVDARYDVRGYLLSELVKLCLKNRAKVPLARRAYYEGCVQKEAIAFLERYTSHLLFGPGGRLSPQEYRYDTY